MITLDVGTTAVKAGIFDETLKPLGFCIREYSLLTLPNGIVELPAAVYWENVVRAVRTIMAESGADPRKVEVITAATQGETLIPVDRHGNPLHNAIVWLDGRAVEETGYIKLGFSADGVYSVTGLPEITPLCPVSKVLWLKNKKPEIYSEAFKVLLLEDYLVFRLTGKFVTNPALMCSTGYFDINSSGLWTEMLDYCGIAADKFPEIRECGKVIAGLTPGAAEELGLPQEVSVSTGAMDQVASAIGSGNIKDGVITETTGTALVVAATCIKPDLSRANPVTVYCHGFKGKYLLVNISQTAGILLKWFRDEFCIDLVNECEGGIESVFKRMDSLAEAIPPLSDGLLLFPHLAGMQLPEVNPAARGVFFGVGLDTGRGHFIRSMLEAVGYILKDNLKALEDLGVVTTKVTSLGGGARSPLWLRIKADICGKEFSRMRQDESTSVGAAILGGLAAGVFQSPEQACSLLDRQEAAKPNPENNDKYKYGYEKYRLLYDSVKHLF